MLPRGYINRLDKAMLLSALALAAAGLFFIFAMTRYEGRAGIPSFFFITN